MNLLLRAAGILALAVTVSKIITHFWVVPLVSEIAFNSSFCYALAGLIGVSAFTKNIWVLLIATGGIYFLLMWAGI